jgi:hypothetical protein
MDTGCQQAVSPRNQIDELAQFQCLVKRRRLRHPPGVRPRDDELAAAAKVCRVANVMRPYLESL